MKPLWKQTKWMGALLVALVTLAVFSPALQGEFLSWDDDGLFVQNPYFRGLSPAHWQWMCTTFMFGHWQPLSWLSYALDYTVWGMNPHGWHFTNLMIHIVNALLVYRLCLDFSGSGRKKSLNAAPALAALFWAVHPLRVEAVAWLSTRGYLLGTTFCLLTVWFYLRPGRKPYLAALLCFALATATKGIGMMLPPVLVLADWQRAKGMAYGEGKHPNNRQQITDNWKRLAGTFPFFAFSLVTGITAFLAKRADGGMAPVELYGPAQRVGQALYGIWFYLLKTVSPQNLSPLYEKPPELWQVLIALVLTTTVAVILLLFRKKLVPMILAGMAYLLLIFPMLGITQSGSQMFADRFTYLATVPFFILLAAGLERITIMRRTVCGVLAALLLGFSAQAYVYSEVWKNGVVLWLHAVASENSQSGALNSLGIEWIAAGNHERALNCFNEAIFLRPEYADALNNRALIKMHQGEYRSALCDLDIALAQSDMRINDRAKMMISRGLVLEELNQQSLAAEAYSSVIGEISIAPYSRLKALQARSRLRLAMGEIKESIEDLNAMLTLPDPSGTFHSLAKMAIGQLLPVVAPVE